VNARTSNIITIARALAHYPRVIPFLLRGREAANMKLAEEQIRRLRRRHLISGSVDDPLEIFRLSATLTSADTAMLNDNAFLLPLVERIKPAKVVETGVSKGVSSAFILAALGAKDDLYSIDLPNKNYVLDSGAEWSDALPSNMRIGSVVPHTLRNRWHLLLGDSRRVLSPLLDALGEIDFFFHDSEHTLDCMLFEYREAWKHLRPGGLIISDDIDWSPAFDQFIRETGAPHARVKCRNSEKGAVLKPPLPAASKLRKSCLAERT